MELDKTNTTINVGQQLTISEALADGYTHCATKDAEYIHEIKEMSNHDLQESEYFLCEKYTTSPSISNEDVSEVISEHIYSQEHFYDENDKIGLAVTKVLENNNFVELLNKELENEKYYTVTKIALLPDVTMKIN